MRVLGSVCSLTQTQKKKKKKGVGIWARGWELLHVSLSPAAWGHRSSGNNNKELESKRHVCCSWFRLLRAEPFVVPRANELSGPSRWDSGCACAWQTRGLWCHLTSALLSQQLFLWDRLTHGFLNTSSFLRRSKREGWKKKTNKKAQAPNINQTLVIAFTVTLLAFPLLTRGKLHLKWQWEIKKGFKCWSFVLVVAVEEKCKAKPVGVTGITPSLSSDSNQNKEIM